jgi:serine protease Do
MVFDQYEDYYEFEVPEYEGDVVEEDQEDTGDDSTYETDENYNSDETNSYYEEYPYDEELQEDGFVTEEEAIGLVNDYYSFINRGDYWSAYELIGGNWKASSPPVEEFAEGYTNTLSTTITETSVYLNDDNTCQVTITLKALESVDTSNRTSTYRLKYVVGYEDGLLKLLGGEVAQ